MEIAHVVGARPNFVKAAPQGTNTLVEPEDIPMKVREIIEGRGKKGAPIPLWDGGTAERMVQLLRDVL